MCYLLLPENKRKFLKLVKVLNNLICLLLFICIIPRSVITYLTNVTYLSLYCNQFLIMSTWLSSIKCKVSSDIFKLTEHVFAIESFRVSPSSFTHITITYFSMFSSIKHYKVAIWLFYMAKKGCCCVSNHTASFINNTTHVKKNTPTPYTNTCRLSSTSMHCIRDRNRKI